jgi:hypothetical protein
MKYRINFGQGQVDYPGSLKKCREYLKSLNCPYAYIQFRDCGEWFNIKHLGK